jgi:hypothetical protein
LYAFDNSGASNPSQVPELKIENCDFNFFLVGMESLINIETNNYSRTPSNRDTTTKYSTAASDITTLWGADRGAVVFVDRSNFKNSNFCWGLMKYRRDLPFMLSNSTSKLINMTNMFGYTPGSVRSNITFKNS